MQRLASRRSPQHPRRRHAEFSASCPQAGGEPCARAARRGRMRAVGRRGERHVRGQHGNQGGDERLPVDPRGDLDRHRCADRGSARLRGVGADRRSGRHRRPRLPDDPAARGIRRDRDPRGGSRAEEAGLAGPCEHDHLDRRAAGRRHQDLAAGRAGGVRRWRRALLHAAARDRRAATRAAARATVHSCGQALHHDVHHGHLLRDDRGSRAAGRDAHHLSHAPRHLPLRRPLLAHRRRARDTRSGRHDTDPAAERVVRSEEGACGARRLLRASDLRLRRGDCGTGPAARSTAADSAAVADLCRRRDAASGAAGRLAGLERLLHRLPDGSAEPVPGTESVLRAVVHAVASAAGVRLVS